MLGKKNERHYGILLFSLGVIILCQSLAIGRDTSQLEKPALAVMLSLENAPAARPAATAVAATASPFTTHEQELASAMASQGLFLEPPTAPLIEDLTYTIQPGDTFHGVARQFGMSPMELATANGLVRPWAPTGTVVRVPRQSAAAAAIQAEPTEAHVLTHRVAAGDTLANVAQRFHMNLNELLTENRLYSGKEPGAGQLLRVRVPPTIEYKVGQGESLWKVSKSYEVSLAQLVEMNDLALTDLKAGQVIRIPVKDPAILDRLWRSRHPVDHRQIEAPGRFRLPVSGARVTDRFGIRIHPINGMRNFHQGIDLAAPMGTPIRAAKAGQVVFSGWRQGYGRCVVLKHPDGCETWYAHCYRLLARIGTRVKGGERLATVGSSGSSTGPHLHFEIRKQNRAVNPQKYLRG